MPRTPKQPGYDDTDLEIALCLGLGCTWEETASICGITKPTISNRRNANSDWMKQVESIARRIKNSRMDAIVADTKEAMNKELNKLRPKVIQAYKDGVEDPDVLVRMAAADKVLDRVDGKSTQKVQNENLNLDVQVLQIDALSLEKLAAGIQRTQRLLMGEAAESPGVITVEPISD